MRKNLSLFFGVLFFSALFLWQQDLPISKTFAYAYAEDGLNTLQQEVIYAKQKQQAITAKMDAVHATLDGESVVTPDAQKGEILLLAKRDPLILLHGGPCKQSSDEDLSNKKHQRQKQDRLNVS